MKKEHLAFLGCPYCLHRPEAPKNGCRKGELEWIGPDEQPEALRCKQCGRRYPVVDGLPHLLLEKATLPAS
jgi:uncharacterized protein YbaR (Trm112 family)